MSAEGLQASVEKMRREHVPEAAIATFEHYYRQLEAGESGLIPEDDIEPVRELPDADALPSVDAPLDEAVVIKLNGGLGTSMGMHRAKSLLEVKEGLTFLDTIARQVLALRAESGARIPLVLMDSFRTRDDSLALLERYEELSSDVPFDFVQHKEPKLLVDGLSPAEWPPDPSLEWCPPGHGDIYPALLTSGMLETLLERGYRYAFMSNSDNLGAVLDPRILAWFASEGLPYVAEVTERTPADRKGGHIAVLRETGGLILRETAQTPKEDMDAFTDVDRHPFFHVNNLWVDLRALETLLREREGVLGLPMIVNEKTVDPSDSSSPPVYQLETAMGAAIGVFEGARAIRVPRSRFVPVKTTSDLLVLRSDAYALGPGARIELAGGRTRPPLVDLDDDYFKLLDDFEARFPAGPPSLERAERLVVEGDVTFGAGVVADGDVTVRGPTHDRGRRAAAGVGRPAPPGWQWPYRERRGRCLAWWSCPDSRTTCALRWPPTASSGTTTRPRSCGRWPSGWTARSTCGWTSGWARASGRPVGACTSSGRCCWRSPRSGWRSVCRARRMTSSGAAARSWSRSWRGRRSPRSTSRSRSAAARGGLTPTAPRAAPPPRTRPASARTATRARCP